MRLRVILVALLLLTSPAILHARPLLERASPASGGVVHNAPPYIALSFSEALVPSGTDAVVRNVSGGVVSSGKVRVIGKDGQIEVPLQPLSPGKYRVEWYATSPDKRHAQGSYYFVVSTKETNKHGGRRVRGSRQ